MIGSETAYQSQGGSAGTSEKKRFSFPSVGDQKQFSVRVRLYFLRYLMAGVAVAAASSVTVVLWDSLFQRNPFSLFYIAVILAAWFGGIGPALMASLLSVLAIREVFVPSFAHGWTESLHEIGMFAFVAVLVSGLISRRRKVESQLEHARDVAERANQAKDQFLAVLSHELRTPLTPALAVASALESDSFTPAEIRHDVGMIRRNIELEARLIDDLLDLTRISRGKLQLNMEIVEVHAVIRDVIQICLADADFKNLVLQRDLRGAHTYVRADPARLRQVLWNLLKNAVKFTPAGGTIAIRTWNHSPRAVAPQLDDLRSASSSLGPAPLTLEPAAGDVLVIEIQDSGIGIDPPLLPRLFDAFEQGGAAVNRQFGGLGLGLAISKALAEMHKGSLKAASDGIGHGATFTLAMPTCATPAGENPVAKANQPTTGVAIKLDADMAPSASLRLLLVEDHEDTANIMAKLLRSFRYEVTVANNVTDALQTASKREFDLVISDLGLPDGTGLQLMEQLRELYSLKGIALSGFGMEDDIRRCHQAGFVAHLTKPVNLQVLRQTIATTAQSGSSE